MENYSSPLIKVMSESLGITQGLEHSIPMQLGSPLSFAPADAWFSALGRTLAAVHTGSSLTAGGLLTLLELQLGQGPKGIREKQSKDYEQHDSSSLIPSIQQ